MRIFYWLATLVAVLDRATKIWATTALPQTDVIRLWPGVLELKHAVNHGMALGIMSGNWLASLVLPIMAVCLWLWMTRQYESTPFKRCAAALILGGFLGNFIDRLLFGHVVDMILFPWMPWFVCNVADIAICAGVGMLVASLLFRPGDWREKHEEGKPEGQT